MEKREWKILEAVMLGIDHYYMEKWVATPITPAQRAWALYVLPTLPQGWHKEKQPWFCMRGSR